MHSFGLVVAERAGLDCSLDLLFASERHAGVPSGFGGFEQGLLGLQRLPSCVALGAVAERRLHAVPAAEGIGSSLGDERGRAE